MNSKNPFEILGITPAMVRNLSGRDLFSLVKASYRALLLIYHPDRTPLEAQDLISLRTRKVAELNLAFEKLDHDRDPASLEHYQHLYARRASEGWRKTIRRLNKEILQLNAEMEHLSGAFLRHLLQTSFPDSMTPNPEQADIFHLKNIRLGLQDIAINHNIRSLTWELGTNYKEIRFDADGRMFYKLPCRKKAIPVNFIRLLGTVEKEKVDLIPLLDRQIPNDRRGRRSLWKRGEEKSKTGFDVLNTLSAEKFRRYCLLHLKPEMNEGAFLFSLHKSSLSQNRINLEGLIIRTYEDR